MLQNPSGLVSLTKQHPFPYAGSHSILGRTHEAAFDWLDSIIAQLIAVIA